MSIESPPPPSPALLGASPDGPGAFVLCPGHGCGHMAAGAACCLRTCPIVIMDLHGPPGAMLDDLAGLPGLYFLQVRCGGGTGTGAVQVRCAVQVRTRGRGGAGAFLFLLRQASNWPWRAAGGPAWSL